MLRRGKRGMGCWWGERRADGKKLQNWMEKKKGSPQAEPKILWEGEADILMHMNVVFYNKAQVMVVLGIQSAVGC